MSKIARIISIPRRFRGWWISGAGCSLGRLARHGAALAAAVATGQALANNDLTQLSLDDILDASVYSASKFQQKASEAPSSVSVITADEIRQYGWRSLGEILRSVRSIYVQAGCLDGGNALFGVVNVTTRNAAALGSGAITRRGGSFGSRSATVTAAESPIDINIDAIEQSLPNLNPQVKSLARNYRGRS